MKRTLAALSIVLSANAASASEEFVCSAWENNELFPDKPFILTKETSTTTALTSLKFKDPYGKDEVAKYFGMFNQHFGMYLTDVDESGYMQVYH